MKKDKQESQIAIYQTEDGQAKVNVFFRTKPFGLLRSCSLELFGTTTANINMHLKNIFQQKELDENSVIRIS